MTSVLASSGCPKVGADEPKLCPFAGPSFSLEAQISFSLWGSLTPEILGHELVLPVRPGHLSSPSVTRLCYTLLQQLPLGSDVELGAESRLLTGFLN